MRIYKLSVTAFICVYVISGILNVASFDFHGYTDPLTVISSFAAYLLIAAITEAEVFLIKNIDHLRICFVFWAVHLTIFLLSLFTPDLGLVLFIFVISPSIGIFNTLTGEIQTFIFPAFCLIEAVQLMGMLLWTKYAKQKPNQGF